MKLWFVVSLLLIALTWGAHAWAEDEPNIDSLSGKDMLFFVLAVVTVINWLLFAITALWRAM